MTFKQALKIVHKLAAPQADSDEEIAALDEVQFREEVMWDDEADYVLQRVEGRKTSR